jgi:hypothetical protein
MRVLECPPKKGVKKRVEKTLFGKGISSADRRATGEQKKGPRRNEMGEETNIAENIRRISACEEAVLGAAF